MYMYMYHVCINSYNIIVAIIIIMSYEIFLQLKFLSTYITDAVWCRGGCADGSIYVSR